MVHLPSPEHLLDLTGKVAVVTGAGTGIGRSVALHLAMAGAAVVVVDRDDEAATMTLKELDTDGHAALAVRADVSVERDVDAVIQTAVSVYGGVDVLVNNAGIFPAVPVLSMTATDFDRVLAVNLRGVFLCSRAAARRMVAQHRPGRIVNVTSVDALHPSVPGLAHDDASRHGVWGFTKTLALELAPYQVWVNAVAPGGVLTPGLERATATAGGPHDDPTAVREAFRARVPMQRLGVPEDIARVVLFLASDLASYMTGSQLVVDGGVLLT